MLFRYSPDRKGEHPREHLRGFSGVLQADGYAGFDQLYQPDRLTEAACWAHVRRKFFDLHAANASPRDIVPTSLALTRDLRPAVAKEPSALKF